MTTVLGAALAGKQATIRDFFLAGRKIHWLAVAGSNIATEISAVTLIAVPAAVFKAGGNLTYLQLMLGAVIARIIIAVWFVPAFYEREIYSPYDYMGRRLGSQVRTVTSGIFVLGAILGQSVRVMLTAMVLRLITGIPLWESIWLIGLVAVVWTLLGGITTVIWTDVIQFFVFLLGMAVAVVAVVRHVPGGWSEVASVAGHAGKLRLWDLSTSPLLPYTLWTALIANTVLCLASYGTDQMMAQRMFCCRGPRQAAYSVIASTFGGVVTILAACVGLGLFAFYQHYPLSGKPAELVAHQADNVFPVFVLQELPVGVTGLIIAGIFAAAISTLGSVLVALSQVVVTGMYRPWRARRADGATADATDRHCVGVAKLLVVVWMVALCGMAQVSVLAYERYQAILDLALSMATYTAGPMLAAFALAFFRLNVDYRGILWAAPLSVLTVFAITWHASWAQVTAVVLALGVLVLWIVLVPLGRREARARGDALRTVAVFLGAALVVFLCCFEYQGPSGGRHLTVAWPWNVPIGFTVAFVLGWLLARPRRAADDAAAGVPEGVPRG